MRIDFPLLCVSTLHQPPLRHTPVACLSGLVLCLWMAFGVAAPTAAAPPNLDDQAVTAKIKSLIDPYIEAKRVDGLSIGVISADQTANFHYGRVSDQGGVPNDDTVYEIGSISKVFTGLLLADAVQRGAVRLDQDAADLLPDGARMPERSGRKITLLDLSIHRSGLPRLPSNMVPQGSENPYADYTSTQAIEFLKGYELGVTPGDKMEYSNFAVSLLGYLVCQQAGKSYDELLAERISGPLGMSSTTVTANKSVLKRLSTGHMTVGQPVGSWEFADLPGAGGIRSTLADMQRFAKANLKPSDNSLGKSIELAWKQHRAGNGTDFAMGLGWHVARDGSTRWHNGQTGGYHSMILLNRDASIGVVLLSNTASGELDQLAEDIIRVLAGATVEPRKFQADTQVTAEQMKRCVGRYQLVPGVVFDVTVNQDRLMVQLTGQPSFQVFAKSDTEWFYKVVPASLTFKSEQGGRFNQLELFQNGVRQTAKRIR